MKYYLNCLKSDVLILSLPATGRGRGTYPLGQNQVGLRKNQYLGCDVSGQRYDYDLRSDFRQFKCYFIVMVCVLDLLRGYLS